MSDTINRGRRDLLSLGVLAAAGWRHAAFAARAAAPAPPAPLSELAYGQVRFNDGPLQLQARQNHRLVQGLDEDALLRPFRVRSGLPAPGQELGGWYDTYAFAPGATFGQWMSALTALFPFDVNVWYGAIAQGVVVDEWPTITSITRVLVSWAAAESEPACSAAVP